ncbi:hypothetical protein ABS71_12885 [bacterium SCN 62-11]|nr:hypothetical protein [Candidatus Eremiobacteraeota bacterium]ODT64671.1 MAG: hypothetical protein ABS71_12885 [bacterium SCN 62-11]
MAGVSELEEMVARLSQDARLDSAGKFTVDLARGLEKLAQLARTYHTRWALFGVQAGVAGKATQMHLSSGLRSESVTLLFPEQLPAQLREPGRFTRFDGQAAEDQDATTLLRQAVQWALAQGSSVNLVVEDTSGGFCLSGKNQHYQIRELPPAPAARVALVRERPHEPWWKNPFGRARNSLALLLECRWRLSFCPVPVKFDGLSLCSGMPYDLPGFPQPLMMEQLHLDARGDIPCLAVAHPRDIPANYYVLGEQQQRRPEWASPAAAVGWLELVYPGRLAVAAGVPQGERFTLGSWWTHDGRPEHVWSDIQDDTLLPAFQGNRCRCRLALYYHARSRDLLYCQRFGILLNPLELTGLQTDAWTVVLADDLLQTDPTGLNPVLNEQLRLRAEAIEEGIRRTQIRLAPRMER